LFFPFPFPFLGFKNPPEPLSVPALVFLPVLVLLYPPSALFAIPKKQREPVRLWRTIVSRLAGRHDSRNATKWNAGNRVAAGVAFCLPSNFGSALG